MMKRLLFLLPKEVKPKVMARKRGTKGRPLNTRPKGRGKAGGKWGHGFK